MPYSFPLVFLANPVFVTLYTIAISFVLLQLMFFLPVFKGFSFKERLG